MILFNRTLSNAPLIVSIMRTKF